MKVRILTTHKQYEFDVVQISWGTDNEGKPIDIVVVADRATIEGMDCLSMYGSNCNEDSYTDALGNIYSEALFARIRGEIIIPNAKRVYIPAEIECWRNW